MSRAGSDGYAAWLQAREDNDFAIFEPALRRNIELTLRYAECFPEAEHPYDPLLDRYEPGTTAAQVTALFVRLREGLVPLLSQIAHAARPPGASPATSRSPRSARSAWRSSSRWASTPRPGAWTTPCTRSPPRPRAATSASRRASTTTA